MREVKVGGGGFVGRRDAVVVVVAPRGGEGVAAVCVAGEVGDGAGFAGAGGRGPGTAAFGGGGDGDGGGPVGGRGGRVPAVERFVTGILAPHLPRGGDFVVLYCRWRVYCVVGYGPGGLLAVSGLGKVAIVEAVEGGVGEGETQPGVGPVRGRRGE